MGTRNAAEFSVFIIYQICRQDPDCSSPGWITQLGPYSKNAGLTESFEDSGKCFLSLNLGDSGNRMPWDKTITRTRASFLNVQPTLLHRAPV